MIKYVIKAGSSFLNTKERNQREYAYKPVLKRMHCKKCNRDTIIEFEENELTQVKSNIYSCCEHFKKRILDKLWPNRN